MRHTGSRAATARATMEKRGVQVIDNDAKSDGQAAGGDDDGEGGEITVDVEQRLKILECAATVCSTNIVDESGNFNRWPDPLALAREMLAFVMGD